MIETESDVGEEWDSNIDWAALASRSARAAVAATPHAALVDGGPRVELSVKFAGDAEVRRLNAAYRGKDRATNVLSFPMLDPAMLGRLPTDGELLAGDIVLAHGICRDEAAAKGIGMEAHAAHLIVHGTLHLIGYDHESGDADAEAMERAERAALASIGIADPYFIDEVIS